MEGNKVYVEHAFQNGFDKGIIKGRQSAFEDVINFILNDQNFVWLDKTEREHLSAAIGRKVNIYDNM